MNSYDDYVVVPVTQRDHIMVAVLRKYFGFLLTEAPTLSSESSDLSPELHVKLSAAACSDKVQTEMVRVSSISHMSL